jgi:hypothetical protein
MPRVQTLNPQVPTKAQPRVQRSGVRVGQLRTPQISSTPSAESFGAGVGETLQRVGSGLLGQELAFKEQEWQKEKQRQDTTRALDADRQLGEWQLDYLDNPKSGLLQKRGQDAFGIHEAANPEFEKKYGELLGGLSSPEQRDMFLRMSTSRRENFRNRILKHEGQEYEQYAATSLAAGNANSIAGAAASYDDPAAIGVEAERIRLRVWNYGKDNGKGAEWIEQQTKDTLTKLHGGVIDRMLSNNLDREAALYYKVNKHEIAGDAYAAIEKVLDTGSTVGDSSRAAGKIWAELGPTSDGDTVSQDQLSAAAREMFKNDPKRATATIQELRQRKNDFDEGRKDRREAIESSVWQMALGGAPLADIQRSPEFRALPGNVQTSISEHVADRLYTLDQRAKSAADYLRAQTERASDEAWETESRNYTREQRAKAQKDEKAYARYEEILSDPDSFARMSENAILSELPNLGRTLTNDLLSKRKQGANIQKASIDGDLFNSVAEDAGLEPFKAKKTDADRARLGALRKYVLDRIDQEQTSKKAELGRDEKQAIMEKALIEVSARGGFTLPLLLGRMPVQIGGNVPKRAFEVKIGDIPLAERQKIEAAYRESGLSFTEQDVVGSFIDQQERAKK